jgi:hypothetical protein
MYVGWAAVFKPPAGRPAPGFEELREHIHGRLRRAPRYRQRLAAVPFGLNDPVWVDDTEFDLNRHVRRAPAARWSDAVAAGDVRAADPRPSAVGAVDRRRFERWAHRGDRQGPPLAWSTGSPRSSWRRCCSTPPRSRGRPGGRLAGRAHPRQRESAARRRGRPAPPGRRARPSFGGVGPASAAAVRAGRQWKTASAVTRSLEAAASGTGLNEPGSAGRHLARRGGRSRTSSR